MTSGFQFGRKEKNLKALRGVPTITPFFFKAFLRKAFFILTISQHKELLKLI